MAYFICELKNGQLYDFNKECNQVKIEDGIWYFKHLLDMKYPNGSYYCLAMIPSTEIHCVLRKEQKNL